MRAVIQRVRSAEVKVDERITGAIGPGLVVFLGIGKGDSARDASVLLSKIVTLRCFEDSAGKMNQSIEEAGGSLLIVSQFTLMAELRGRRPSFDLAAPAAEAKLLYDLFLSNARATKIHVQCGEFQADMQVHQINDGPVTLICDTRSNGYSRD
ncbi:MAG: D-tyrosyl-tRNA(Tyr) deacylase [Bryobacterales bacterium]|nr:D-tyrosyl-tRNA(Tyr) deacylase [Bryobacterales bacterium]